MRQRLWCEQWLSARGCGLIKSELGLILALSCPRWKVGKLLHLLRLSLGFFASHLEPYLLHRVSAV